MERQSIWAKVRQLRVQTQISKDNAYRAERQALDKLEEAERLMTQAAISLSNARHTEEVSNLRQKRLDQAYVKLNKSKQLIDRRGLEQTEHDLFLRDPIAKL